MPTAKKQSVFSKINFKSPKTRIILTIALFAIVGGGVMVFRSFADSNLASFNVSNAGIEQNPLIRTAVDIVADPDPGKNGNKVYKLTAQPYDNRGSIAGYAKTKGYVYIGKGSVPGATRACAMVKSPTQGQLTIDLGSQRTATGNVGLTYANICTPYAVSSAQSESSFVTLRYSGVPNGAPLYISQVTVDVGAAAATPAPTK